MTEAYRNVLCGKKCYLGGPIQHDTSNENWRSVPSRVLRDVYKIDLFDPFSDPKQQFVPLLQDAIKVKDYETMREIAKTFVRKDLCIVDRADFLISYLPYKVPTTGTHHEIIVSSNAKKPTLLVCPEGKEHIPAWYYGFIPIEHMFGGWSDLYTYLDEVNEGKWKADFRWSYVYGLI